MVKPKVNKRQNLWANNDIEKALHSVSFEDSTIKGAARRFGMSEGTLRNRIRFKKLGKEMVGSGRKPALSEKEERDLAECIRALCEAGFSPSPDEIKNLVRDYVQANSLKTPFKDGRPGKDWFHSFLQRQRLSTKKASMISAARKANTANPFLIYDFYDVIEKIISEKNLKPEQVWNCDESGFPTDPSKCRVVAPVGKPGWKITTGAGRENITVLATCSASGRAFDPLILFAGKNFQSTWKGSTALPNTMYGISDNGWMTTDVFGDWFEQFIEYVKERPLLLVYDGHLSHVSIRVIQKAIAEDIIIVKFPPHITDKMQPLDVCCFSPLKRRWEKLLADRTNVLGPRETMTKSIFVDLLCSIWHEGLSLENSISGFKSTGICPVNRSKYPIKRFDPRLLKRYNHWVSAGKPQTVMEDMATSVNTPKKTRPEAPPNDSIALTPTNNESINDVPGPSRHQTSTPTSDVPSTSTATPTIDVVCTCSICKQLGPKPPPVPGKSWVPAWTLQTDVNKSFQELVLDKIKGPQEKKPIQRKKVDATTRVITEKQYVEKLENLEKKKTKKKIDFEESEEEPEIEEVTEEEIIEEDESDESEAEEDGKERLIKLWKSISDVPEKTIINKWYGAIYEPSSSGSGKRKKQPMLFVGKALHRFKEDVDGPVTGVELDCLVPPVGETTILKSVPSTRPRDIGIFSLHNIVDIVDVEPLKGHQWNVPNYNRLKERFNRAIYIDRELLSCKSL